MPLSAEVGVSGAAYSELLDESKFTFFFDYPVLLHHNESFSRLCNIRKLDSTEKHDN